MDLRDRRGRDRGAIEGGEELVDVRAELCPDDLVDGGPADGRGIVLEPAQFGDELVGQQIPAGGGQLTELDEGDAAVVERETQRAGQMSATVRGAQLGPTSPSQVGKQAPTRQDPAELAYRFVRASRLRNPRTK